MLTTINTLNPTFWYLQPSNMPRTSDNAVEPVTVPHMVQHPALKNDLIMDHIFKLCTVRDLKACRLVDKFWNRSTESAWKKYAVVPIWEMEQTSSFLEFIHKDLQHDISTLYDNFSFSDATAASHLCEIWGSKIKFLELKTNVFSTPEDLREIVFHLCPNLKRLRLSGNATDADEEVSVAGGQEAAFEQTKFPVNYNLKFLELTYSSTKGISWMEIFSQFPAVEVFNLDKHDEEGFDKIFAAVRTIRAQDPTKLMFREIRLCDTMADENSRCITPVVLQTLVDPQLPLRHLYITMGGLDNHTTVVREILNAHRDSLRSLKFNASSSRQLNPHDCFPRDIGSNLHFLLPNFQEIFMLYPLFTSLTFLRFTPHLKKLTILLSDCSNIVAATRYGDMAGVILEHFVELRLGNSLSVGDLQKLKAWFPNVERLAVPLNNNTFAQVCQNWPRLVYLKIYPSTVDESGLTGLDKEYLEAITTSGRGSSERPPTVPRAAISNLKHLRRLSMYKMYAPRYPDCKLSRSSVLFGMQSLTSLQELHMTNYLVNGKFWKQNLPKVHLRLLPEMRSLACNFDEIRGMA